MGASQAYGSAWSIGRFQVDRRSFPAQVLLVGPGPGDGGLGPGLVHGGYGSLHPDDGAGLHGVAQRRRPGACGQAAGVIRVVDDERGPLLGDLGDLIDAADGVRVWCRSHLGPDAGGFPLLVHEPLGSAGAYLRVHAERGIPGQAGISTAVCSWALTSFS